MNKISDELRDWCDRNDENGCGCFVTEYSFEDICDLADRIDAEMVELPKDADGEYIHIGDVMEWCDSGETLTVEGIGSDVLFYIDGENAEWTAARNKRHHHEPTVEDVLREFAYGFGVPVADSYVAATAAKLRHDLEEANNQAEEVCIENAKLRELVEDMLDCVEIRAAWHRPPTDDMCDEFAQRARELGVEV